MHGQHLADADFDGRLPRLAVTRMAGELLERWGVRRRKSTDSFPLHLERVPGQLVGVLKNDAGTLRCEAVAVARAESKTEPPHVRAHLGRGGRVARQPAREVADVSEVTGLSDERLLASDVVIAAEAELEIERHHVGQVAGESVSIHLAEGVADADRGTRVVEVVLERVVVVNVDRNYRRVRRWAIVLGRCGSG